uniref:Cilia-and flagella-associated protein 96 n=1 Tax=Latimeria chalumnae TaxID=7897 RepID=H2ZYJ8_LATCH
MPDKTDLERIGLFSELGYVSIGDRYVPAKLDTFNDNAHKNKQMLPGGSKQRSGLQAGYFDPQFNRIFEKEAYSNPVQLRRQFRIQEAKKNVGKAFLPSNGDKKPSGLGSYYGTLSGPIPAFSAQLKARSPHVPQKRNIFTSPPKEGTGYGYPNVTIGKPYPYSPDSYDRAQDLAKQAFSIHRKRLMGNPFRINLYPREYFENNPYRSDRPLPPPKRGEISTKITRPFKPSSPAKKDGGMKAGTFDPYPTHSADPYVARRSHPVTTNKEGKIFHPGQGARSRPVRSILEANVVKKKQKKNTKTLSIHQTSY